MNRLVIIGNGFDLFHGLRTSYTDFLIDLLIHGGNKIEDLKYGYKNPTLLANNSSHETSVMTTQVRALFDKLGVNIFEYELLCSSDYVNIDSRIIKASIVDIKNKGWTDIEAVYYQQLVSCYKNSLSTHEVQHTIEDLNNDLDNVKECLAIYLASLPKTYQAKPSFGSLPFPEGYVTETTKSAIQVAKSSDIPKNSLKEIIPTKTLVLNFNYTTPHFRYIDRINIHGILTNPSSMIFGYGDETDENYTKIEKSDINEYLRNFKSHCYIQSNNYKQLSDFVDADEFLVMTVGHSCGRSDHVLLGEIFNHTNCTKIEINYHKFDTGKDDFNSIAFNIGRAMPNKIEYRRKLIPKEDCRTMEDIHNL